MSEHNNKGGFFSKPVKAYNSMFKSKTEDKDKQDISNIKSTASNSMHDAENQSKDINMAEEEALKPVNRHDNLSATEKQAKSEIWDKGAVSDKCPSGLNFRKEPLLSSEVISVLYPGDEVAFTDTDPKSNWCKVKKDGKIGYCLLQYIVKIEPNYN